MTRKGGARVWRLLGRDKIAIERSVEGVNRRVVGRLLGELEARSGEEEAEQGSKMRRCTLRQSGWDKVDAH